MSNVEAGAVFDSLESTCKMMTCGINRCLDYMKASSNIVLQPAMETFELSSTVAVAVRCVTNHLNSASKIIVHPLSPDICPFLITDKQWLGENVLCLLSNAVKYSNAGVVDLRIELVSEINGIDDISANGRFVRSFCDSGDVRCFGDDVRMHFCDLSTSGSAKTMQMFDGEVAGRSSESKDGDESKRAGKMVHGEFLKMFGEKNNDSLSTICHQSFSAKNVDRRMIRVSVEDTGIGIEEEARKNLFQPFKQAQRSAGGTGELS